jgi:ubiquitin-like 1-activating enzyme E1 A
MADLTDEQAAIYDRQIRVWGADVQKRLTGARVLLLGCTTLASEVAKNFVLAGIGQLTVVDDTPAASSPITFLHSSGAATKGSSIADVFVAGLQELNPMVTVQAAPGAATALPDAATLKDHQLVLAFGLHGAQQSRLNALCREHGVAFIAACSKGPNAVAFADLLTHGCKIASEGEADKASTANTQLELAYTSLADTLGVPWADLDRADKRQLNPLFPVWAVVTAAEIEHDRVMVPSDFGALDAAGAARCDASGLRAGTWRPDLLLDVLEPAAPVAPVDAIVGGFLGNDVVRALSHVGLSTHNVLCFRMEDNTVQMHNVTGSPGFAKLKAQAKPQE